jgi:hypothetical protein
VCIMSILTTESAREVSLEVIVPPLSWLAFIVSPLGVLVSQSGRVFSRFISSWSRVVIVLVSPFLHGIIRRMVQIFHIHLFKILNSLNMRWLDKVNTDMWLSLWSSN